MRTLTRIAAAVSVCALLAGVSTVMAGRKSVPAPPPPVLCGCACPEGIVIVHAPDENSCEAACASACLQDM